MTTQLNNMFNEVEDQMTAAGSRGLSGTAQLTTLAATAANSILIAINEDLETYRELFIASKTSHGDMDKLISQAYQLETIDIEFLKDLDDDTVEGMLKSQQSKRSRTKGKVMTMDNYKTMMVGAIAEWLLRSASGKSKAVGHRHSAASVSFSDEDLQVLADDQERLRKELRNVQSKKSIMKSKEGFSETDDRWQALLVAEAQLKDLRSDNVKIVAVDKTKLALTELLGGQDVHNMKPAEAKKLLELVVLLIDSEEVADAE